jgi:hypothetical protein
MVVRRHSTDTPRRTAQKRRPHMPLKRRTHRAPNRRARTGPKRHSKRTRQRHTHRHKGVRVCLVCESVSLCVCKCAVVSNQVVVLIKCVCVDCGVCFLPHLLFLPHRSLSPADVIRLYTAPRRGTHTAPKQHTHSASKLNPQTARTQTQAQTQWFMSVCVVRVLCV